MGWHRTHVGGGLPPIAGCQPMNPVTDVPLSGASPLPRLDAHKTQLKRQTQRF
ncbi:hypothetical protein C4J97_0410 [Pseudomonas orientalis]|nr:hypothetical protein C4J97_0410 [Pseudomonas orientalis]